MTLTPRSEGSGDLLTLAMSPGYATTGQGIGRTGSWSEEQYSPPKNTDKIEGKADHNNPFYYSRLLAYPVIFDFTELILPSL